MDGASTTTPTPRVTGGRVLRMADYKRRTPESGLENHEEGGSASGIRSIEPTRNLTWREVAHRERMLRHLAEAAGHTRR